MHHAICTFHNTLEDSVKDIFEEGDADPTYALQLLHHLRTTQAGDTIMYLLHPQVPFVDLNAEDGDGNTVLMLMVVKGLICSLQCSLYSEKVTEEHVNYVNSTGKSIIEVAIGTRNPEVVSTILTHEVLIRGG